MLTGVGQLGDGVDSLLSADFCGLAGSEMWELVRELETLGRRLAAVDHRVLAEVESRRLAGDFGRASTVDLLVSELRVAPAEARSRVAHAGDLGPRASLTGEPLPALLPVCAEASVDGVISAGHVSVIVTAVELIPAQMDPVVFEIVERTLVDAACHEHPGQLKQTAVLLLNRINPDGVLTREKDHERNRNLALTYDRDGAGRLKGRMTPEATVVWQTVLDSLSAPTPAEDGDRDKRSAGQRAHDGLHEAGMRLLRSGALPASGGVPVTILVRTTAADLTTATTDVAGADAGDPSAEHGSRGAGSEQSIAAGVSENRPGAAGIGLTTRGDVISLRSLLACGEADIIPVLIGETGDVLRLGRTARLANRPIRLALTVRDGGCCFPGCAKPASWTEVHHIREWQDGGTTDIANLCLLCRYHHREFAARGWTVRMTGGVPEWVPPPWLDPDQRPRRNTVHHPPDLQFGPLDLPAAELQAVPT